MQFPPSLDKQITRRARRGGDKNLRGEKYERRWRKILLTYFNSARSNSMNFNFSDGATAGFQAHSCQKLTPAVFVGQGEAAAL